MKRCTKCGNEYPATTDYFVRAGDRPSGLNARCKICTRAYDRNRKRARVIDPVKRADRNRRYRLANLEALRSKQRSRYEAHKEERREYHRTFYANNRDRLIAKSKRRYWANHARSLEWHRSHYRANRKAILARKRVSAARHREAARRGWHVRRARKQAADGSWTKDDIQKLYDLQRGKCWWCKKRLGKKYHIDHRVPLSRGGTNWPSNLVLACARCNLSKQAKLPDEFNGRLL